MTYDLQCYSLACYFLDDTKGVTEQKRMDLAGRIQQTIDDYGQDLQDEAEAAYGAHIDSKIDEIREGL